MTLIWLSETQYTSNDLKRLSKDDVSFYQEEVFKRALCIAN
ncbi:MAG: hypothetical protein ACLTC1_05850 [Turicibacter sp.]